MKQAFLFVFFLSSAFIFAQSPSPEDRRLTDPKSVVSLSNASARPIPIADLYYTRTMSGDTWLPDGREIVFTYDLTGRSNLWKISSEGGWPIQLTSNEDRQYFVVWSPDGKWIAFQQDSGGNELWDVFPVPASGGQVINLTNSGR